MAEPSPAQVKHFLHKADRSQGGNFIGNNFNFEQNPNDRIRGNVAFLFKF